MRILQVNKYNYLRGGSETVFFNTIEMLQQHGHEVARMSINHPRNEPSPWSRYFVDAPEIRDIKGVWGKICSIPRFFSNRDAAIKMEQLIADFRPDIAHLHNIFNGISLSILPVLKQHGIPVVITLHDTRFICPSLQFNLHGKRCDNCLNTWGLNCGLHRCYENSLINSWMCAFEMLYKEKLFHYDPYIDHYIFASKSHLDKHASRHSYFGEKGCVLYNFAPNINNITPNPSHKGYFLFYGRIIDYKGIATLIESMKSLPDITLKVAGTGPMLDQLRTIATHNVQFVGYKTGNELFDLVKNASFIIVPSECEENNPMTVVEGYTYGKPVIGSAIGGIPEIIVPEQTGYVFTAFDKDALTQAIRQAASITHERYAQMSHYARAFAETHFNPATHYDALMEIYDKATIKHQQLAKM